MYLSPMCQPFQGATRLASGLSLAAAIVFSSGASNAESAIGIADINCAAELDATVTLATNPDHKLDSLTARFASLEKACPDFAQIAHNQGVLAARQSRWPQAIAHFERALQKDERAADTHRHLQQIFEHRAANAYAKALDTAAQIPAPVMQLQDSGKRNSDGNQQFPEHQRLRNVATLEYELYAWWNSLKDWNGISEHYISEHYVDGYNVNAIKLARQQHLARQWPTLKREIAFTHNDAVVVLSDSTGAYALLLMRLEGSRWKVYQETSL